MAIGLQNYPNITPPNSDYLYGRIKDNPGDGSGTPVNAKVCGDMHEFLAKLMGLADITPNGLPENEYSGHQYIEALNIFGNKNIGSDIITGLLGTYTTNDLIILWGCAVTANIGGTSSITQGAIFYNGVIYKVDANASISSPSGTLVFKINSSVNPNTIYLTNGTSNSGIADYNASNVKYFTTYGSPVYPTTLLNSYTDPTFGYRKDSFGNVQLLGGVSTPTTPTNNVFFILPIGFRPRTFKTFPVGSYYHGTSQGVVCYIEINGECRLYQSPGALPPGDSNFNMGPVKFNIAD